MGDAIPSSRLEQPGILKIGLNWLKGRHVGAVLCAKAQARQTGWSERDSGTLIAASLVVGCAQAGTPAGLGVHAIEPIPPASSAALSESGLHGCWRNREDR